MHALHILSTPAARGRDFDQWLPVHLQISRGDVSEEDLAARREKGMADPAIQAILTDPVMRQVYGTLVNTPEQKLMCPLIRVRCQRHIYNTLLMADFSALHRPQTLNPPLRFP